MNRFCSALAFCCLLLGSCSSIERSSKNPLYEVEVVEAEGMAPLIKDGEARKSAIHDAMQSALGLVVGVYVSQESLVSKAVLIDESIKSQTEGYIEKYEVIKEWQDDKFYHVRIRAHVRKEDLAAKLSRIENEAEKLGNPVIAFQITEKLDGKDGKTAYCDTELKSVFTDKGFKVSENDSGDIIIKGDCRADFNTKEGLGGFISYRASVALKAVKSASEEVIDSVQFSAGGIDLNKNAAAQAALINAARKGGEEMRGKIISSLKKKNFISVTARGLKSMNEVVGFINSLRNIPVVRDCWLKSFGGGGAILDVALRKGNASDFSRVILKARHFKIEVLEVSAYSLLLNAEKAPN